MCYCHFKIYGMEWTKTIHCMRFRWSWRRWNSPTDSFYFNPTLFIKFRELNPIFGEFIFISRISILDILHIIIWWKVNIWLKVVIVNNIVVIQPVEKRCVEIQVWFNQFQSSGFWTVSGPEDITNSFCARCLCELLPCQKMFK